MEVVTAEVVQEVVRAACGGAASPLSWTLNSLASSFCLIRCLKVEVQDTEDQYQRSFIVKQAPGRSDDQFEVYRSRAFLKEHLMYSTLGPAMDRVLVGGTEEGGEEGGAADGERQTLPFPRCYYADCTPGKEILVLEDVRPEGYRMSSHWILDEQHARLVLRAAARLHAASLLLQRNHQQPLVKMFPLLQESWELGKEMRGAFESMVTNATVHMAEHYCAASHLKGVRDWLKGAAPHALQHITQQLQPTPQYCVLTHADLHSMNVMFRYGADGAPVDVMLIDLQVARVASPAADISYFTHFSLLTTERNRVLPFLLDQYYDCFSSVLKKGSLEPPYTKDELTKEVRENKAGLFLTIMMLPIATIVGTASGEYFEESSGGKQKTATEGLSDTSESVKNKEKSNSNAWESIDIDDDVTAKSNKSDRDSKDSEGFDERMSRRTEIAKVLQELAEEAGAMHLKGEFDNAERFLWKN